MMTESVANRILCCLTLAVVNVKGGLEFMVYGLGSNACGR